MQRTQPLYGLDSTLDVLVYRAVEHDGVPLATARRASSIARARLDDGRQAPDRELKRRAEAYFWGVIRRQCLTSCDSELSELRARFVLASVRADLERAGLTPSEIDERIRADFNREVQATSSPQLLTA
jgi:hypothetical protein